MKLAAVDIGSNAVRLQVSSVLHIDRKKKFKKIEYLRFPLRLGYDVFKHQCISAENEQKLIQLLHAFKLLIDLHEVEDYIVCGTSALREANNKLEIVNHIEEVLGISVHIVQGAEEALLIDKAIRHLLMDDHDYLHVDVGGGSTEVSLYIGKKKVASHSFDLGSIKLLENCDTTSAWEEMQVWISVQKQCFTSIPIGIATGGNIRKLAQLAKRGLKKPLSLKKLEATKAYIASYSLAERINGLELNPDRADVILPAIQIYGTAMRCGDVKKILVPDVSLRDGIIQVLYERNLLD